MAIEDGLSVTDNMSPNIWVEDFTLPSLHYELERMRGTGLGEGRTDSNWYGSFG